MLREIALQLIEATHRTEVAHVPMIVRDWLKSDLGKTVSSKHARHLDAAKF